MKLKFVLTLIFLNIYYSYCQDNTVYSQQNNNGTNTINIDRRKVTIYKTIQNIYSEQEDQSLLYVANEIAELRNSPNQPQELISQYIKIYDFFVKSLKDKKFYKENKNNITILISSIFKLQQELYFKSLAKNDEEYKVLREDVQINATQTSPHGTYVGTLVKGHQNGYGIFTFRNGSKYIGQFKDDLFDGFGILHDKNRSIFYGSFKRGNRDGLGIDVLDNGDVYQGEYKNDSRNGVGKYILKSGDYFFGEFVNGQKGAKGINVFNQGVKYIGEFKDGKENGYGTLISPHDDVLPHLKGCRKYVGNFQNGKMFGFGRCYDKNNKLIYEGAFHDDDPLQSYPSTKFISIYREVPYNNKDIYKGYFVDKLKEGQGRFNQENGVFYSGEWRNDLAHGYGMGQLMDGSIYEGEFRFGAMDGYGIVTLTDGNTVEGLYKADQVFGTCIITYKNLAIKVGKFENGNLQGKGIIMCIDDFNISYCEPGRIYIGEFTNGKKEGYGLCMGSKLNLIYEGEFEDDKPIIPCPQK